MVEVGNRFETLAEAKEVITRWLLDGGKSYQVWKMDSKRIILRCRDAKCTFRIRVTYTKSEEQARVTVLEPHMCSPVVHLKNKAASSVRYLKPKHQAAIIDQLPRLPEDPEHASNDLTSEIEDPQPVVRRPPGWDIVLVGVEEPPEVIILERRTRSGAVRL